MSTAMAAGSSGAPPYNPYELKYKFNASMAIIVVVLVTTFFFMALFVIYIRRCNIINAPGWLPGIPADQIQAQNQQQQRLHHGLDPESLQKLPVFQYSTIKNTKKWKAGSECAVCLLPYDESEKVRLLPDCGHLFHTDCIDMWLDTHSTCPLCRRSLEQSAPAGPLQRAVSAVISSFRRESIAEGRADAEPARTDVEAGGAPTDSNSTVELANASMRHNQGEAVIALSRQNESFKNAVHDLDLAEVRDKMQRVRSLRTSNRPARMNHSRSFAGLAALDDEGEHDELSELHPERSRAGLRRSVSDGQSLKSHRPWTEGETSNSTRTMFSAGLRRSIKWLVGDGSEGRKEQV